MSGPIRAAEQNLIAANANIGIAKTTYFPRISLTGAVGGQSNQLGNLLSGPSQNWNFIPQVTQPIFAGGQIKSNVKLAEAQRQTALVQYEKTIQTAFREVSDALAQQRKVREIGTQRELLVTTLRATARAWPICVIEAGWIPNSTPWTPTAIYSTRS